MRLLTARIVQWLGRAPLVGRLLRWYAHRFPEGSVVTIPAGAAKGMKWRRHHRYVNGYWIGQYELGLQSALVNELRPGATFFDVGANAGFFTLIGARRVGAQGTCVAFDPDPDNAASIQENCELNGLNRVIVVRAAVAETNGTDQFSRPYPGASVGTLLKKVSQAESFTVSTMTLDAAIERYGKPDVIKVDVEGAEDRVLGGATRALREYRPVWLIEVHTPQLQSEIRTLFERNEYRLVSLTADESSAFPRHVVARPESGRP